MAITVDSGLMNREVLFEGKRSGIAKKNCGLLKKDQGARGILILRNEEVFVVKSQLDPLCQVKSKG